MLDMTAGALAQKRSSVCCSYTRANVELLFGFGYLLILFRLECVLLDPECSKPRVLYVFMV